MNLFFFLLHPRGPLGPAISFKSGRKTTTQKKGKGEGGVGGKGKKKKGRWDRGGLWFVERFVRESRKGKERGRGKGG